jgi:predicted transcriptional regulator
MLLERDEAISIIDESGNAIGVVNRQSVASMLQAEQQ